METDLVSHILGKIKDFMFALCTRQKDGYNISYSVMHVMFDYKFGIIFLKYSWKRKTFFH